MPENPSNKKMSTGKKIIVGIVVLLIIGIIGSQLDKNDNDNTASKTSNPLSSDTKNNTSTEQPVQTQQENSTSENTVTPKSDYKIGDEIKFSNYVLQVTKAEVGKIYNEVWTPEKGKKFVAVEVLITNNSQENVEYNILSDFNLTDENNYEYSFAAFGGKDPALSAGDIQSGRKIRGWITFEVDKSSKQFELIYSPGFFSSEKLYINLQN